MKRQRFHCSKCGIKYEEARSAAYCKKCWNEYYANKRATDPAAAQAARDATAKWRERNAEAVLAKDRAARRAAGIPEKRKETNPTIIAARAKASKDRYRAKPEKREKELAQSRAHGRAVRESNPNHVHALDRARYKRDIEKRRMMNINNRARRAGAPGSHTIAEWKSVLRHHKRKCAYCKVALTTKNVSKDHRTPLVRGGTNDIRNIIPACRRCNSRKHTRTFEEFMQHFQ